MSDTIQIDHAGRLVLPKRFRERFRLEGGDSLAVQVRGDAIELRPMKAAVRLMRINGVLVISGGEPLPEGRDFVAESREERITELMRAGTKEDR